MKIFFTSDTHFGHANIKYCNRPFKNLDEMNNRIITNWNNRVKKEDIVFHLGDFAFKNSNEIRGEGVKLNADYWLSKLNGKIIILKGNHDSHNSMNTPIESITLAHFGKRILLIHNPEMVDEKEIRKFDYVFCGHVHNNWRTRKNIINVGVDVWNFMPVTFDEL
jgi:calcineurin-like phosphoesterase family protein